MMRILIIGALSVIFSGCAMMNAATEPTAEQREEADYAQAPNPDAIEPAIRAWALYALKDPSSLQIIDLSKESEKGWLSVCTEPGIPPYTMCTTRMFYFGHLVRARINAKNSMGGYGGYKRYTFLFRGNEVTRYISED